MGLRFDEIGLWSEIKLDIIKRYAEEYSKILTKQGLHHVYIDAFAGAGEHISKQTKKPIPGSPLNALLINPPFKEYHLIDLLPEKAENLRKIIEDNPDVNKVQTFVYCGDCNPLLLSSVFPRVRYEDYRRALCILDPYGLHLDWQVLQKAGRMKSVDIFLNFPIMDMNRNVIWKNPEYVDEADVLRMNSFWGDSSWRTAAYQQFSTIFGQQVDKKVSNAAIASAFRERLQNVAGFKYVPEPIPMRNKNNATVYYLFFASQNKTAHKIVEYLFQKYAGPQTEKMDI